MGEYERELIAQEAARAKAAEGSVSGVAGTQLGCTELATGGLTITTTQADITGLSVTVTVPTGSAVDVEAVLPQVQKDTTGSWVALVLMEDGIAIQTTFLSLVASGYGSMRVARSRTPSPGSHTYKCQALTGATNAVPNVVTTGDVVIPYIKVTAR